MLRLLKLERSIKVDGPNTLKNISLSDLKLMRSTSNSVQRGIFMVFSNMLEILVAF